MDHGVVYRKSVTPGAPPASSSQRRLAELKFCPLGRLVGQIVEIDQEILDIRQDTRPSRMAIAALIAVKYNVLKALLPYAFAKVPEGTTNEGLSSRIPVTITLEGDDVTLEERTLVNQINNTLEEVRITYDSVG